MKRIIFCVLLFTVCGCSTVAPQENYSAIMCEGREFYSSEDGAYLEVVLDDENNTPVKIPVKNEKMIQELTKLQPEDIYGIKTKSYIPQNDVGKMFSNAEITAVDILTKFKGYEKYFEVIDVSARYKRSFVGRILEETTEYMMVEPVRTKADEPYIPEGDRIKIEYENSHYDYLYGKGRRVVIYYEGDVVENDAGVPVISTEDISTDGFRDFEISITPSNSKKAVQVTEAKTPDATSDEWWTYGDAALYYYGIDAAEVSIKGWDHPLEAALEMGRITLAGLVAKCNRDVASGLIEELVYKDGGSRVYKYPDYTIIKFHTLDGNRDVYIGTGDMDINTLKQSAR